MTSSNIFFMIPAIFQFQLFCHFSYCFIRFSRLLSLFCPCVPVGQAAEAAGCGHCTVCAIACIFFPPIACCVRGAVRRKRNIVGDCCSDACALFCCQVCAISQMARESGAYQMGENVEKAEEAKEDNVFMISQSISRE